MFLTDWGHLVVDDYGVFLRKKHGRIVVVSRGGREEFPVRRVREVIISGKAGISTELLKLLADSGIDVLVTSYTGRPVALFVHARSGGSVRNRIEQYRSLEDGRACKAAAMIISGKLSNQVSNLKYYSKPRKNISQESKILYEKAEEIKKLREKLRDIETSDLGKCRENIMSIEAQAANTYWDGMRIVLGKYGFKERVKRGRGKEVDPVNLCLNIIYNKLAGTVWKYVLRFSLDPFQGFLHARRPGKLSLVYDLMEPFRPIADRFIARFLYRLDQGFLRRASGAELAKLLTKKYYEEFTRQRIEYKARKMTMEAAVFWFVQEIVRFLNNRTSSIQPPYMPW
ncbi:CRISPR-associated endonuclease Cas1 [Staphylothermus marinus]|uniref:CRISPR-associated endonuclease Cas1 n=1 Tax=Staphylothermus marinus TaxID=2280 RepID=UPI001FCC117B|nr:CRISPR-associated endonuclease Cas1 [Staphylothermus marinus]